MTTITIHRTPKPWLPLGGVYEYPLANIMALQNHAAAWDKRASARLSLAARVQAKRYLRKTRQPITYDNIYTFLSNNPTIVEA